MKKLITLTMFAAMLLSTITAQNPRGQKREQEACEQMAMEQNTNPRASGSGISTREDIAFNTAKLQARNELAAQIAAEISSIIQHKAEQWQQTAGAGTDFNVERENYKGRVQGGKDAPKTISGTYEHDSTVIVQKVSQILNNTVPICKNTYDQTDGKVQVYVCIEMNLQNQRQAYAELKEANMLDVDVNRDGSNDIDFNEKEFLLELAKAREEYNNKKAQE